MKQLYIADDNTEFATYIAKVAKRDHWSVVQCANGRELLEQVTRGTGPALLLVDINMPELDGIEAVNGLAQIDRPLRIRFITGGADTTITVAQMIAKARNLTVGQNLYKPLAKNELLSVLAHEAGALVV